MVSTCSGGEVTYWHASSGKSIISIQEESFNDIYALDFSPSGELFSVGGKEKCVKIYDDNTKSLITTFKAADEVTDGHSNRIFSIKFVDENILLTGGWDNNVFI